jgi:HAE1 family hydrophobic/amphiphilic exporter-1
VVALTVVPVLAYWFLKPPPAGLDVETIRAAADAKERRSPLQRTYLPVIRFATRRRWTTLLIGVLILLGTFGLSTQLKTNFLDQSGQDSLSISQELPVGTSLATTDAAAKQIEAVLAARDDVKTYQVTVGNGEFNPFLGSAGASGATFQVGLEEGADAVQAIDDLRAEFDKMTGIGEVAVGGDSSGLGGGDLAVDVRAADAEVLAQATEQVRQAMAATAGVTDVSSTLAASVPRLDIEVKRDAAARNGLTEAAIGRSVAGAFRPTPAGQITVGGATRNVVISFGAAPADPAALRALPITTPRGVVRLDQVATVTQVDGPEQVTRVDGNRSATVSGTFTGSDLSAATSDLTKRLDGLTMPAGASYTIGGVSAEQADAFRQLGLAVLAAIAIVFIIMVATFRSLIQPVILLVSIPFAATGAIVLLLVTGTALGVPALIGVLMLVGIVVTNAIVLMDLINHYRLQGMPVQEAVIEGGRHRLRPILMTAIATIFALLPMALGLTGEGGFISQPLAIVVIGGLVSSTLLTLVLVPTLYTMVENRKERSRAKRAARHAGRHAAPEPGDDGADRPEPTVPAAPTPSPALRGYTDQFEVLKVTRRKPNGAQ